MSVPVSQIKLYGPGISKGLEKLNEMEEKRDLGDLGDLGDLIKRSGLYIGEKADYEIFPYNNPSIANFCLEASNFLLTRIPEIF